MQIKLAKISSIADPNAAVYVAYNLDHVQQVCEMIDTRDTVWSRKQIDILGRRAAKGEFDVHDRGYEITITFKTPVIPQDALGVTHAPIELKNLAIAPECKIEQIWRNKVRNNMTFRGFDEWQKRSESQRVIDADMIATAGIFSNSTAADGWKKDVESGATVMGYLKWRERATIAEFEGALEDARRLVRELDVSHNGEEGAAPQASLCDIVARMRNRARPPFVVCELICQKPSVSVHPTEAAALTHAVQCAVENLCSPDEDDAIQARTEFETTLTDYSRICEGDYEVHILTPSN